MTPWSEQPFCAPGRGEIPISASIGIATLPHDARTAAELIAIADLGLYGAKAAGGSIVQAGVNRPPGGVPPILPPPGTLQTAAAG